MTHTDNTGTEQYESIINSYVNSKRERAKEKYALLSDEEKEAFKYWFLSAYHYDIVDEGDSPEQEYINLVEYLTSI